MSNLEAVHALIEPVFFYIKDQVCHEYPYPNSPTDIDWNINIRCGCDWEEDHTNFWKSLKHLIEDPQSQTT